MTTSTDSGKKWYQKPENITSGIFIAILSYIGYNFGAALFAGALNLMGFMATMGVLALIVGFFVTQRRLVSTVWNVLMYKLTNSFYKIEPMAIAWTRLNSLKQKAEKINAAITKISGTLLKIQKDIERNNAEIAEKERQVQALNKLGKQNEMKLVANQIARANDWNTSLIPIRDTLVNMKAGMNKIYDAAEFVIKDKEDELTSLEKRYESVKIGWSAVKEAQDIYGKNSADRQDLEQLIGLADTDMNNKLAEMDRFMELASPVFMESDIQNTMNDAKAQEVINRLTNGGEIDQVIANLQNPNTPAPITTKVVVTKEKEQKPQTIQQTNTSSSGSDYDVFK